jgi:hypothetical protein
MAALDVLFEKIRAVHYSSANPNAFERIREIGIQHSRLLGSQEDGFVFPLFEFMAAPPEEGQAQGTIAAKVDPYQVAWYDGQPGLDRSVIPERAQRRSGVP